MNWFLSQDWCGLVIALGIGLAGWLVFLATGVMPDIPILSSPILISIVEIVAFIVMGLAFLLGVGALNHIFWVRQFVRRHPPLGRLIDVGGYKLHILAEGSGGPTVVWIPGSHDQGLALYNLHKELRNETRSILYDRACCGRSDTGPFPRDVTREVAELKNTLKNSGESGPFIFAAHSFGGMLAQNFADRHPEDVAGLVLLDSACPDAAVYTRDLPENKITGAGFDRWFLAAFGLTGMFVAQMKAEKREWLTVYDKDMQPHIMFGLRQPRLTVGFISALNSAFANPFDLVKGQYALGDIPIFAIIPPVPFDQQVDEIRPALPRFSEQQLKNFVRIRIDAQEQNARLSRCGELRYAPEGTTHSFPTEVPEFTLQQVRDMIEIVKAM